MGRNTQATDWEFAGMGEMGAAVGVGGGGYIFMFRSETAGVRARVCFLGGGLGLGESVGYSGSPPSSSGGVPYSSIHCDNAFSLADLNNSGGRIMNIGLSALVGYSAMSISAFNVSTGVLFDRAGGHGMSIGSISVGATALVGMWTVTTVLP